MRPRDGLDGQIRAHAVSEETLAAVPFEPRASGWLGVLLPPEEHLGKGWVVRRRVERGEGSLGYPAPVVRLLKKVKLGPVPFTRRQHLDLDLIPATEGNVRARRASSS